MALFSQKENHTCGHSKGVNVNEVTRPPNKDMNEVNLDVGQAASLFTIARLSLFISAAFSVVYDLPLPTNSVEIGRLLPSKPSYSHVESLKVHSGESITWEKTFTTAKMHHCSVLRFPPLHITITSLDAGT